jgi:hypothetical protein
MELTNLSNGSDQMPDFWSHQLASKKIKKLLKDKNPSFFKWDRSFDPYYYFGAQGPDFFFYINQPRFYRKVRYKSIGNHLHTTDIQSTFKSMLDYLSLHQTQALKAYVAGYITHYILDLKCHPLICKWGPDSKSHKEIELVLDAMIVWQSEKMRIQNMSMKEWRFNPKVMTDEIGVLWRHVLKECAIGEIPTALYMQATKDMRIIQVILLKNIISTLPFVPLLSRVFNYDLKLLSYPKSLTDQHYSSVDFDEFWEAYIQGIEISTLVLKQIDEVYTSHLNIESIIDEYFKKDYLGEATKNVQNFHPAK